MNNEITSFTSMDNQTITLILLALCILPIVILGVWAIVKTVKNAKKNTLSVDEVDLDQRNIFYEAFGGDENVLEISIEVNRITYKVLDIEKVDGEKLKDLGATGVLFVGDLVKVSFGDRSKYVYKLMEK